jgi:predicted dithiol-disulfide oxidoreductase (DUF899 family)
MQPSKVVPPEEWIAARRALLDKEKARMRNGDALAAERRALPWVRVEKAYAFDPESGPKVLPKLFDGSSQLIVHHLMYALEWSAACPSCSFHARPRHAAWRSSLPGHRPGRPQQERPSELAPPPRRIRQDRVGA